MQNGKFITFEGGEGVGKTTQINVLANRLAKEGIECVITREPGGSLGAEAVRHVLLSGAAEALGVGSKGEAILFAAARADHVDTIIRPALQKGKWVLCDRFMDSTRIYQGEDSEVPPDLVDSLERIAIDGNRPHLTFILDLRAEIGMARANERRDPNEEADRFERETISLHEKRRQAYLRLAQKERDRFRVIDASQNANEVSDDIWLIVKRELLPQNTEILPNPKSGPSVSEKNRAHMSSIKDNLLKAAGKTAGLKRQAS